MTVFAWERVVQGWLEHRLAWATRPLTIVNFAAGDQRLVIGGALLWSVFVDQPLIAIAVLLSPALEALAKEAAARPRPHTTNWGLPSGDCMIATAFWPHVLGIWAVPLIATIALARLVRGAHFPLDVITGIALGAALWRLG